MDEGDRRILTWGCEFEVLQGRREKEWIRKQKKEEEIKKQKDEEC